MSAGGRLLLVARLLIGLSVGVMLLLGALISWAQLSSAQEGASYPLGTGSAEHAGLQDESTHSEHAQERASDSVLFDPYTIFLPLLQHELVMPGELPFGVQAHFLNPDLAEKVEEMGARWVRTSLHWEEVEPVNTTPEYYQWPTDLDERFAAISAAGAEAIVTIQGNPKWAATYRGGPLDKLNYDATEMVDFVQAAVERYSGPPYNVKYWEFYNEQDNGDESRAEWGWGYFGKTPELYVDLLVELYPAIKAADPQAKVVFGGMSYDNWYVEEHPERPMVREFIDQVLAYGENEYPGRDYFDLMNFHYYEVWRHNWDPPNIIGKANSVRDKLQQNSVHKPIICTEAGMWSHPSYDPIGDPDGAEQQSRYIPQLYARAMSADLVTTIWYELVDVVDPLYYWHGLLTSDWKPKPAYHAYQTLAQQMENSEFVRRLDGNVLGSEYSEGYQFHAKGDTITILIAWTNDGGQHPMVIEIDKVEVIDKWGDGATVRDNDDGLADGRVEVVLGPSPVYIRYLPGDLQ